MVALPVQEQYVTVAPGEQASLSYWFRPDENFPPREFQVRALPGHHRYDEAGQHVAAGAETMRRPHMQRCTSALAVGVVQERRICCHSPACMQTPVAAACGGYACECRSSHRQVPVGQMGSPLRGAWTHACACGGCMRVQKLPQAGPGGTHGEPPEGARTHARAHRWRSRPSTTP